MISLFVLRRNWVWPIIGLLLFFGGIAAMMGSFFIGGFAVWMGLFIAPTTLIWNAFPSASKGTLQVVGEELELLGRGPPRRIAFDDIVSVKLVPRPSQEADTVMTIESRTGQRMWLWLRDADARGLSERIGRRRAQFPLVPRPLSRFLFGLVFVGAPQLLIALFTSPAAVIGVFIAVLFQAGIVAVIAGQLRGSVTVGVDGITIRWPLRRRFLRFEDIHSVQRFGSFTSVTTAARQFRLYAREQASTQNEVGAESAALHDAVLGAWQRHQQRETGETMLRSLVARGSQTAKQWLATLDRLARGGTMDYRMRAVDRTMLRVLADDASEELDTRVGAAAALVKLDPTNRVAIRIAAEATADVDARARLLEVSEAADDLSLEIALEGKA